MAAYVESSVADDNSVSNLAPVLRTTHGVWLVEVLGKCSQRKKRQVVAKGYALATSKGRSDAGFVFPMSCAWSCSCSLSWSTSTLGP